MEEHPLAADRPIPSSTSWLSILAWPLLIGLAWLIFELTAQPGLSVPVLCAKFGWEDYRTARWLKRRDPDRRRGRMCYWFYVASSLWRMAVTATLLMFAIAAVMGALERNRPAAPRAPGGHLLATLVVSSMGFGFSIVATYVAMGRALRYDQKIWLDPAVHQARKQDAWPPPFWSTNRASRLIMTAVIPPVPVFFIGAILTMAARVNANMPLSFIVAGGVLAMVLGATLTLVLRDFLARRIAAAAPWECWGMAPVYDPAEESPEP
jgi:hypothetical protein